MSDKLGARLSPQGLRDFDFFTVCGENEIELPKKFELPVDKYADVLNQLDKMACVGFSLATACEYHWRKTMGDKESYSPWYNYVHPENRPNYNGSGMYTKDAVNGTVKVGFVPLRYFDMPIEMPELAEYFKGREDLTEMGKQFTPKAWVNLNYALQSKKIKAIKQALYVGQELLIVTSKSYFGDPHCFLLYGWDDDRIKGFSLRNSWGEEYGNNGNGEIPIEHINEVYQFIWGDIDISFEDVKQSDWFYNDICKGVFTGLVQGVNDKEFKPYDNLIRGDVCVMLARTMDKLAGSFNAFIRTQEQKGRVAEEIEFATSKDFNGVFYDVSPADYYYNAVRSVCANGYMHGVDHNLFEPTRDITRAEFIASIMRAHKQMVNKISDSLKRSIITPVTQGKAFCDLSCEDWFYEDVSLAGKLGIVNGDTDGKFRPHDNIIRAEATAIFNRWLKCIDGALELIR